MQNLRVSELKNQSHDLFILENKLRDSEGLFSHIGLLDKRIYKPLVDMIKSVEVAQEIVAKNISFFEGKI